MSTLASKVAALERHRRAVARELAGHVELYWYTGHICQSLGWSDAASAMVGEYDGRLHAVRFDVHAAREHAKGLVAMKRHAGVEHVADDWRRGLGGEPAQRWQTQAHGATSVTRQTWCEPRGLPPGLPSDSMNWRSLARLGQRILDMLEGECPWAPSAGHQPSECSTCCCLWLGAMGKGAHPDCEDCHGTGHNLRGKLPKVEWSPAVRRKVTEAERARGDTNQQRDGWTFAILDSFDGWTLTRWDHERGEAVRDARTRVCPRGEHRTAEDPNERAWGFTGLLAELDHDGYKRGEHVRVHGYGKGRWRPRTTHDKPEHACTPRWRRGEIEHARQRREREARRDSGRHWRGFEWTAELQGTIVE